MLGTKLTDPTRTGNLRLAYGRALTARFNRLKGDLVKLIQTDDALGKSPMEHPFTPKWMNEDYSRKVQLFKEWLQGKLTDHVVGNDEEIEWRKFTVQAYQRGVLRAYDEVNRVSRGLSLGKGIGKGSPVLAASYQGARLQFMKDVTTRSLNVGTLRLLSTRMFNDLKGVTEALTTHLVRSLSDGLVTDHDAKSIVGQLIRDVTNIGIGRAKKVSQVDTIRSYNEGKLDAYEQLQVKEVGVEVEWSGRQSRTCRYCSQLSSATLSIPDARGKLPVHIGCCCSFVPSSK